MCSKNADLQSREGEHADSAIRRIADSLSKPSITRRLTLLYVASTAALLLLTGGSLYWIFKQKLEVSRRAMLSSKIEVLRLLLRQQPDKADVLASEVEHEASASQPIKYYIRILDEQGGAMLETPGMKDRVPASLFPPPLELPAGSWNSSERELHPYRSYVLLSVRTPAGRDGVERRTLQIGLDVSTGMALLADYRRKLLAVLGIGMIFAMLAGVWVARQGMRPLLEITRATQHITASQLHERIAGSRWPAELADLAASFDAMLDRLEDSFIRLSQFSADLAHALRTPINNLRGEAEVALGRCRTPEEYQHTLASSLEECDRLSRMIDGLLFLARADDPQAALERVQFDARKQIDAVREFYEAVAAERQVTVICEGEGWLTGDPMLFRRAVSNLLGNALRHTPAQGTVRISISLAGDQTVELNVRDTGSGIAPEHLPKVFDRFYRANDCRSHGAAGTGLGLAIVRSIVRLHGGTAAVESSLKKGTTVTLKFPASIPPLEPKMTKM